jgi:N-acetylglucosamine malate deacetylase 1
MDDQQRVDILAFSAHADDIELTCGGTLARAVADGKKVGIVDLTHAEMGTRGTAEIRLQESQAAADALGASFRLRLDFGDGGLRTGREEELEIIRLIREHRPEVVIAPYPDDRHPDHTRAGRLLTDAWFYAGLRKIETGQPAHRPQAVIYFLMNYLVEPSFVVNVTHHWETKMNAIRAYRSQFHDPDSSEPPTLIAQKSFLDRIEGRARHFGALIGAEFGEAFFTKTPPRVDDITAAYRGREVS